MEIVLLLGMPKIQETANRNNNFSTFTITPATASDTGGSNYAGAPIDSILAAIAGGQVAPTWRIAFSSGISAASDSARVVYGFRVVMTKGFRGDYQMRSYVRPGAMALGTTNYTQSLIAAAITPQLTGPEGQYFELVFDYATGAFELYIDGSYVNKGKMTAGDQPWRRDQPLIFDLYVDQWNNPTVSQEHRGLVKDLYMGKLAPDEVFEPLGTLNVEQLLTQSLSYDNGNTFTPTKIDQWNQSTYVTLDSTGVAEHTSTFQDPTPLKTAKAVTIMTPYLGIDGVGAVVFEARSGGAKIADQMTFGPDRSPGVSGSFIQIDPSKIGTDLKVAFKIAK